MDRNSSHFNKAPNPLAKVDLNQGVQTPRPGDDKTAAKKSPSMKATQAPGRELDAAPAESLRPSSESSSEPVVSATDVGTPRGLSRQRKDMAKLEQVAQRFVSGYLQTDGRFSLAKAQAFANYQPMSHGDIRSVPRTWPQHLISAPLVRAWAEEMKRNIPDADAVEPGTDMGAQACYASYAAALADQVFPSKEEGAAIPDPWLWLAVSIDKAVVENAGGSQLSAAEVDSLRWGMFSRFIHGRLFVPHLLPASILEDPGSVACFLREFDRAFHPRMEWLFGEVMQRSEGLMADDVRKLSRKVRREVRHVSAAEGNKQFLQKFDHLKNALSGKGKLYVAAKFLELEGDKWKDAKPDKLESERRKIVATARKLRD